MALECNLSLASAFFSIRIYLELVLVAIVFVGTEPIASITIRISI